MTCHLLTDAWFYGADHVYCECVENVKNRNRMEFTVLGAGPRSAIGRAPDS